MSPQDEWTACGTDLDCAGDVLVQALRTDPELARAWVASVPSPESRWLLVSHAIHADPANGSSLCAALSNPSLKSRCTKDTSRPHLYSQPPRPSTQPGARTAPGPHVSTLVLRPSSPSRFATTSPDGGSCPTDAAHASCAAALAQSRAAEGKANDAAAACLSITGSDRWQSECALQAAEMHARNRPPAEAGDTMELCLLAGEWMGRCVHRIHIIQADYAPAATADAGSWVSVHAVWRAMRRVWARQPEALQTVVEDHFWSTMILHAYRVTPRTAGVPLTHLPAVAHPHVRAAAAWNFLRSQRPTADLEEIVSKVQEVLSHRTPDPKARPRRDPHSQPRKDFWPQDNGTEGSLPAVHYLGMSRRVLSQDPEEDLQICILEAAARYGDRWRPLLEAAQTHPAPLLSATATRLLEKSGPPRPRR